MELSQWLTWIIGGTGAGAITYWLMEKLAAGVFTPEQKRYISLALSCVLASLAYVASVALNYSPEPADWQAWIETLFSIWFVAVTGGQVIHGRQQLRD